MHTHHHSKAQALHFVAGFSAIELMVAVAIVAILAALAAPSFTPLLERWRVRQAVENMTSTLYYARSEAIKRGGRVGIQKVAQGTNGCKLASTNEEWGCGWFVFVDSDDNGKWKSGEEILQTTTTPTNTNLIHKSGRSQHQGRPLRKDERPERQGLHLLARTRGHFVPRHTRHLHELRWPHTSHRGSSMHLTQPPGYRLQRGITLIESLVAILVMAIGILGILGLQIRTLTDTQAGVRRAQAIRLIEDLGERLQNNPDALGNLSAYTATHTASDDCASSACAPDKLATYDIKQWRTSVTNALPGSQAIVFIPQGGPRQLGVLIGCVEREHVTTKTARAWPCDPGLF